MDPTTSVRGHSHNELVRPEWVDKAPLVGFKVGTAKMDMLISEGQREDEWTNTPHLCAGFR